MRLSSRRLSPTSGRGCRDQGRRGKKDDCRSSSPLGGGAVACQWLHNWPKVRSKGHHKQRRVDRVPLRKAPSHPKRLSRHKSRNEEGNLSPIEAFDRHPINQPSAALSSNSNDNVEQRVRSYAFVRSVSIAWVSFGHLHPSMDASQAA